MTDINPDKLMQLRDEMVGTERAADAARERMHEAEMARVEAERAFLNYAHYGEDGPPQKFAGTMLGAGVGNTDMATRQKNYGRI